MEQPQGKRLGTLKNGNPPCDLWSLPKCQATAKSTGNRCGNIAVKGKRVCYLHGGKSPGVKGNKNAQKHGYYSKITIEERYKIKQEIQEMNILLKKINFEG